MSAANSCAGSGAFQFHLVCSVCVCALCAAVCAAHISQICSTQNAKQQNDFPAEITISAESPFVRLRDINRRHEIIVLSSRRQCWWYENEKKKNINYFMELFAHSQCHDYEWMKWSFIFAITVWSCYGADTKIFCLSTGKTFPFKALIWDKCLQFSLRFFEYNNFRVSCERKSLSHVAMLNAHATRAIFI